MKKKNLDEADILELLNEPRPFNDEGFSQDILQIVRKKKMVRLCIFVTIWISAITVLIATNQIMLLVELIEKFLSI